MEGGNGEQAGLTFGLTVGRKQTVSRERCVVMRTGKGKGRPRTCHEGPEGEQRYSSTLSLTPALDIFK